MRVLFEAETKRRVLADVIHAAVLALDARAVGCLPEEDKHRMPGGRYRSAAGIAWHRWNENDRWHRTHCGGSPLLFEVAVFPHRTGVYGLTIAPDREMHETWMRASRAEDFAFWDNSDPPEDLPTREWRRRARIWDDIFPDDRLSTPAHNGFIAQIVPPSIVPPDIPEDLSGLLPPFRRRVREAALRILARKAGGGNADPERLSRALEAARRDAARGDATETLRRAEARARARLTRRIAKSALLEPLFGPKRPRS